MGHKTPVILDTDIGGDIDDTWALAMLLKSPELELKLVVTDTGDTIYRARVAAKLLASAGRSDVPIGVGLRQGVEEGPQAPWVADYALTDYDGEIIEDGVDALIETIMSSPEPVTLISIGPVPNVATALAREPRIAANARFVGMHGSVRLGYGGSSTISAEYNVKADAASCRRAFAAPWEVTITPLDTCGLVQLRGDKYARVRDCQDPLVEAVMDNYRIWAPRVQWAGSTPERESSVLFDTVAVYLAFDESLVDVEHLPIQVTDDGYTVIEEGAPNVRCATRWRDLGAFEDLLVERLTSS
jgi:inosine-uridine nucleoside N-ribohydrolase